VIRRPIRRVSWLPLAASACVAFAAPETTAERIEVRTTADGRRVEGAVVVEAEDGGVLLELADQRYELLQPDQIADRRPLPGGRPAESPREVGRRILGELPPGFQVHVTKHFVVCFDTSRDYAVWCAALFERLSDTFLTYWSNAGLDVRRPAQPLIVVIFAARRDYEAFAARDLGAAADRVVGYYNMLTNRVTTFDLTQSDTLRRPGGRPGHKGAEILASPEAAGLVATLVHEATHQMAFNCGLHRRLAPVPVWLSEGVATCFETPDLGHERGWRGIGGVNQPRLEHYLQTYRAGWLREIVADDEPFRRAEDGIDWYARAWALTHFLMKTRRAALVDYLEVMATKTPCGSDPAERRLGEFERAFGCTPDALENDVHRAMIHLRR